MTAATGRYGRLVIDALLRRGVPADRIVAAARNPEAAADLVARGIEVRKADYDQPETLRAAFRATDRLLLVPTTAIGHRHPQMQRAIEAAKQAGVRLLAYAGFVNSDRSTLRLGDEHKQTEADVRASGIPFVMLRNGAYIEAHAGDLGDLERVLESGVLLGCEGDAKISGASRADLAEAAAVVLTGDDPGGKVYELGGTPFTKAQLAGVLSELTGRSVRFHSVSVEAYTEILVRAGLPPFVAEMIADTSVAATRGDWFTDRDDLEQLLGRPSTALKTVVEQTLTRKGLLMTTKNPSPALRVALAYHEAWKNHDHATAMKVVADDVTSETPFGRLEGAAALDASEAGFAGMLKGATMVAAYGDQTTALLLYYTHTQPVPSVLSAKYFTVEDGKITSIKALFDKSVFART